MAVFQNYLKGKEIVKLQVEPKLKFIYISPYTKGIISDKQNDETHYLYTLHKRCVIGQVYYYSLCSVAGKTKNILKHERNLK